VSAPDVMITELRAWTRHHDAHIRAAVELLIDHGTWPRRPDFTRACVHRDRRQAWIDWAAARAFADAGAVASTSEIAILDLAVALGENRYRLSIMGSANSRLIATAVTRAGGVTPVSRSTASPRRDVTGP
jgi:hypothetical protein